MPLPPFNQFLYAALSVFEDGQPHSLREARERAAAGLRIADEDKSQLLGNGRTPVYVGRTDWAVTYLYRAGALERVSRGIYKVTARGLEMLRRKGNALAVRDLMEFPEFLEFWAPRKTDGDDGITPPPDMPPPVERLEAAYAEAREALAAELLDRVKQASPQFFEQLVLDLLTGMGYGGSIEDAASAVGRTGDGGIDGVIKEDKLGLDVVYVQAKRWGDRMVSVGDVRDFSGALDAARARKGVFITTSRFTQDAREYVQKIEKKIVLIDGRQLAELMIDHDVGVTVVQTYKLKRVDSDYFESE